MNLTAKQLYWRAIGDRLVGVHATVLRNVQRTPHFTVPAGSTGVMLDPVVIDGRVIFRLLLDDPPKAFGGECHWIEGTHFSDFKGDLLFHRDDSAGSMGPSHDPRRSN